MTCGCKTPPIEGFLGYEHPYDNQAIELVSSPTPNYDVARPEVVSTERLVQEYTPQPALSPNTPGLPAVFQLQTPLTGLSFGGFVPYNVVAFVMPIERVSVLTASQATLFALSQSVSMDAALSGFLSVPGLDQYWIMRPGESIEFGRKMSGFCGFFAAPWSGLMPRSVTPFSVPPAVGYGADGTKTANAVLNSFAQQTLQAALAAGYAVSSAVSGLAFGSTFDATLPTTGSVFAPVFRCFYGKSVPLSTPYTQTPWVFPNVSVQRPNCTVCVPPGTRYVTITFNAGPTANPTPTYQSGSTYGYDGNLRAGYAAKLTGTFDMLVEWVGYDGIAHAHPADQLTVAARGQISATHDIEVFEVPRNAAGLNISYSGTPPAAPPYVNAMTFVFSPS